MGQRKLFCEYGPLCYRISLFKERSKRRIGDAFSGLSFARESSSDSLPTLVKGHRSLLLRPLEGVDLSLQHNKIHNLRLAIPHIDGIIVRPGETFSFWRLVGPAGKRQGYLPGLTVSPSSALGQEYGGGLCQLANMIHWLVLHSPLNVTELHHHSDALFPDEQRRVPFGTGTSIFYNRVDYRFYNSTTQPVQLRLWVDDTDLCGELRAEQSFLYRYRLTEEDAFFSKEGNEYFRNSSVYRITFDKATNQPIQKQLLLQNHSRVMYDPALIPPEQLRKQEDI